MARIALDVMGTDRGPAEIVAGALMAADAGEEVILVGRREVIEPEVSAAGADLEIVHAPEVVEMYDPPTSVRKKQGSSVMTAARMVAKGEADALVSAGSTGAAIAAASIVIGRLRNVQRPAIATPIPRPGKVTLLLDAGANVEVRPTDLVQFGVMGALLAEIVYGIDRPRVGLLNIGGESSKGRVLEREAFTQLEAATVDFVGNVEGGDITQDVADVVVTDGFTGNVVLKTMEGAAGLILRLVGESCSRLADHVLADLADPMERIREIIDPEQWGGAHVVGISAGVVICHGSSSRFAISNAIQLASEGVRGGLVERLGRGLVRS